MIRTLKSRLYRDRRRYALCLILLFAAGALTFHSYSARPYGLPFPLIAGLAFMIGVGVFMPLISLCLPFARFSMESNAIALILFAALGTVYDRANLLYGLLGPSALWFVFVFFCIGFAINRLLYATWSDKLFYTNRHPLKGRARSHLSQQRLWDGFTLAQGREHLYHSDLKNKVISETDHPRITHILAEMQPGVTFTEKHEYWCFEPPHEVGFKWSVVGTDPSPGTAGTATLRFIDKGRHRVIERTLQCVNQPWRTVWTTWIDDGLGRLTDQELARLEKREAA
ncbi:hypothetical protein [uncultured Roseovarius sp.]|uniref:hypothetical protein n=1 Tax=uncultured Roseovarius sp. TaxID=293344 RepID=UPI0025E2D126|nr:hypothetical protein [uncultured Roseovarius sp.]